MASRRPFSAFEYACTSWMQQASTQLMPRCRQRVTTSLLVHAGQGQIHLQPFLDPTNEDDARRMHDHAIGTFFLGEICSGKGDSENARTHFLEARTLFREMEMVSWLKETERSLEALT